MALGALAGQNILFLNKKFLTVCANTVLLALCSLFSVRFRFLAGGE